MNEERDRLSDLLKSADCVPDASDCRRAVMERIAAPPPRFRLAWAYAALMLAVIGLVLGSIRYFAPAERPAKPMVVKVRQAPPKELPVVQPEKPRPARKPRVTVPLAFEPSKVALGRGGWRPGGKRPHRAPKPEVVEQPETVALRTTPAVEPPSVVPSRGTPVAMVVVAGPPAEDADTAYGYRQTDPETGRVIECSGSRTGNKVELYCVESNPGGNEPPVKGSLDYEIPNV